MTNPANQTPTGKFSDWRSFLSGTFPNLILKPFANHQIELWDWAWAITAERPRPFVALWSRGATKCLAWDTEILCADGIRKQIKDIRVGDSVLSYDERRRTITADVVSNHWHGGLKPCIKITTKTRKQINLTKEHRVLTFGGWKTAGELTLSDRIASPRNAIALLTEARLDEEVRLLAYMLAEGGTSGKGITFTNADQVIVDDFIRCANTLNFEVKKRPRFGYRLQGDCSGAHRKGSIVSGVRKWLVCNGMDGKLSKDKRIPKWVFGLSVKQKWVFLAAMIDTDGWVAERGEIGITLASKGMVDDLLYLFMQVGVVCSVIERPNDCAGAWAVIVDNAALVKCLENLPLILKGDKLRKVCETPRYSLLDTYPPSILRNLPNGLNRRLRDIDGVNPRGNYRITRAKLQRLIKAEPLERWTQLEDGDVFWDEIKSIEDVGEQDTFDVEVRNNHNLISNGLITHNSTSAELIAAMVGIERRRPYIVYVSGTQDLADKHVQSIGALLEAAGITRSVNRYGSSKGWRRDRLRTDTFTIDSLGLDTAARGIRVDDARPGLIVLDDVDSLHDTAETVRKKTETLTETILPSGSNECAVLFVQNLMHRDSIASKIADGRADFLSDRIVSGPHPALLNFSYEIIDGVIQCDGVATWEGQSLDDCKHFIKTWGLRAFLRECQHQVNEAENGIWKREFIEKNRVTQHPALIKIVVGVDPPGGLRTECGIVTNGIDATGHLYTLDDSSLAGTPEIWGRAVVTAYYKWDADIVVAEQNFGGEMVLSTIHNADPRVPVKMVTASRGKTPRAEPIALLCQEGKEHHVGTFALLEAEQCSWVPDAGMPSPNRVDAHTWSCIELTPRQGTWVPKAKAK